MNEKPFASATERNSQPILAVIREEFRNLGSILEIGSGTGQHAVCFGSELGHLVWQTSDVAENHAGILAWLVEAALPNVRERLLPVWREDGGELYFPDNDGPRSADPKRIRPREAAAAHAAAAG